jgi:zinc protease
MQQGAGGMDALGLALAVDEIGASLSVHAGWDSSSVTVFGLSRDLDRLVEILAAVVREPAFDDGEAARIRAQQVAGLRQAQDSPGTIAAWQAARALYPDHRYGLPSAGTLESVERLDAAAARSHYRRVFRPDNAIVFASGDIDAADWARRSKSAFGDWKAPRETVAETPAPPDPAPASQRIVVVDRPELGQARIVVTHGGIARTSERRLAASLVNSVLGGSGFSSRLMQRIRSDEGLTYGVSSGFSMRRQPGPFSVATFTRVPEARRVVDLILEGVRGIRDNPPSALELATTKSYAVGRFGLNLETSASVLASIVDFEVYGLPEDTLDTYRARIRAIDLDDTAAAARDFFHPDRSIILVLGPAKQLVPQLESLGRVSVITP